jgi:2-keto-3-deoxy-6-phosphogluconate aldolase
MGSKLIRKDLVAAGQWDEISANVRQVLEWIGQVRAA